MGSTGLHWHPDLVIHDRRLDQLFLALIDSACQLCHSIPAISATYASCTGDTTTVTPQTGSCHLSCLCQFCCTRQTSLTGVDTAQTSAIKADYATSAEPAFQLLSKYGAVPAISATYTGYAISAIPAATDSMALAELAAYADYATM